MWEAIASNRRRSFWLITLMGVLLAALGGAIGATVDPERGMPIGVLAALAIWLVLWLTARAGGDAMLLAGAGARRIEKQDAPALWNIVEEMTLAAGLPKMPAVYIIDETAPNAFAVGRTPEKAAVAVTAGLLKRLNRDELQGVVAHELGHVRNLDIRFMTLAAVMLGAIVMLSDLFLRSMRYRGHRRGGSSRNGGGQAQALLLIAALVLAVLGPILAQVLYFACSRRREYLADASGARYTRYPEGLASALEKIAGSAASAPEGESRARRALAPLYIINPLKAVGGSGLFSTHPPTEDRVRVLRAMAGAGLAAYETAYRSIHGGESRMLGERTLAEADAAAVRPAGAPAEDATAPAREALHIFDRAAGLAVISCPCGLAIKLPGETLEHGGAVQCPRCGREHNVPAQPEAE